MKTTKPPTIAVVGSGVIGLSSCLALARDAYRLVLCGSDDPSAMDLPQRQQTYDTRVYALNHLSCRLLEQLGAWPAIKAAGRAHPYTSMKVWEKDSHAALEFYADEIGAAQLGYIVETKLIKAVLFNQLKKMTQVEIACPSTAAKIELKDQRPLLQLDDGRLIEPDLLVGADGARSMVRRSLRLNTAYRDYKQDAVTALMSGRKTEEKCCWQCFSEYGITAWLPLRAGLGVLIWSCPRGQAAKLLRCTEKQFSAEVGRLLESRLGVLRLESEPVSFPLYGHLAESCTAGHCVLVGDAAHAVHPLAGQGANLGLADVYELRESIRHYRGRGRTLPSLAILQRYQRSVKGRNWAMKLGTDCLFRWFSESAEPYRFLRSQGLRFVNRCAPIKKWFMRQAMQAEQAELSQERQTGLR